MYIYIKNHLAYIWKKTLNFPSLIFFLNPFLTFSSPLFEKIRSCSFACSSNRAIHVYLSGKFVLIKETVLCGKEYGQRGDPFSKAYSSRLVRAGKPVSFISQAPSHDDKRLLSPIYDLLLPGNLFPAILGNSRSWNILSNLLRRVYMS